MSMLSRRIFIHDGFKVVSLGLAMPHIFTRAVQAAGEEAGQAPSVLHSPDQQANNPFANRTLVVVQMAGGNDGLNTVVPYNDPVYLQNRRNTGIPEDQVLKLDDRFGLHPAMGGMKSLWDEGKLSIVHGVGYPNPSFSHFRSMDIYQTANPEGKADEGWLAKLVKGSVDRRGHPFAGFAAGGTLPPALMSPDYPIPAVSNVDNYRILPDPRYAMDAGSRQDALVKLYQNYPGGAPFAQVLQSTEEGTLSSVDQLQKAHAAYKPAATYPTDGFGSGLKLLAETIVGNLGVKVGYVTIGGFDTHSNQRNQHQRLLQSLSGGLRAFWDDLTAQGKADNVMVMTWSEFGRRVGENGSNGTDHGTATPQFIIGNGLKGGHWGDPVDLGNLSNGNLRFTTDFRSVYATVMDGWLGAPADKLLGARFPTLGFLGNGSAM
ncbi:MAG TPA: DUF1501 domain-containing protein [Chloroflexota bacterium]|jgi:uncharacterized protein (DUF1501 family)|nr:DUF1501 domain-containing protein [Chloroflexota bacterium]